MHKVRRLDGTLARLAEAPPTGRMVDVEAVARGARRSELEQSIRELGGTTTGRYRSSVEARVPARALEMLANDPAAARLRSPNRPQPQLVAGQGVSATGAGAWQAAGTTGAGVEIAIVDIGFRGWRDRSAEGELPPAGQVAIANFCPAGAFDGTSAEEHGTAIAEIVHELAPAARLHLICIDSSVSLGQATDYVVDHDIPIVNHSVGWLNTSRGDGTGAPGSPEAIVAEARAQGVLWINAAGNYADLHWSGAFSDPDHDDFHNFNGDDEGLGVVLRDDEEACVYLKWDDWPATDQDYDLYLFRTSNDTLPVAVSESLQDGTEEPTEELCYPVPAGQPGEYYVAIASDGATEASHLDVFITEGQDLEYVVAAGSVVEPATSPGALSVGAACVHSGALDDYSSRGPTIDGRIKPDLVGQDANSTKTYGDSSDCLSGFGGTSAAAAHVTGAAALLKQANPALGPAELQAALEGRAVDLGTTGKDTASGAGRLALGAAPPPPAPAPANVALPSVSGLVHQGQSLTASDGSWTDGPTFFLFRWLRCDSAGAGCASIAGARGRTYMPTASDVGQRLRVRVTAFNAGGASQATSLASAAIEPPLQAPANVIPPSLAGEARVGQILSAAPGAWSGTAPLTITVEWLRCSDTCGVIPGAASPTYRLGNEDIGFTVRVRVTAANPAGSVMSTSAPTDVVPRAVAVLPTTGGAAEGQPNAGSAPNPAGSEPKTQIRLVVVAFSRSPLVPRAGRVFVLVLRVATRTTSVLHATRRVLCTAVVGGRALRASTKGVRGGVARCAWLIPKSAAHKRMRSSIAVYDGGRSVRRTVTAAIRPR